jgi:hypothetical protein
MSTKTVSQMEAVLMDKIEKAKLKLEKIQYTHKVQIGNLAYKHGLHQYDLKRLDEIFLNLAKEVRYESPQSN